MSATLLRSPDGAPLSPQELTVGREEIGPAEVEAARRSAYAAGMVIEDPERVVYAFGKAAELTFPAGLGAPEAARRASQALADLSGRASPAALAIGALPFDPTEQAALVLPALCVVAGTKGAFRLTIGDGAELPPAGDDRSAPPPDEFSVEDESPTSDYVGRVAAAVEAIRSGELAKVVLARAIRLRANRPYRQADLLGSLRKLHPSCAVFALDGFIGATPELLVSRQGGHAYSRPLAGTIPRGRDGVEDDARAAALWGSDKERREHRFVVEPIAAAFSAAGGKVTTDATPHVVELANVFHLETSVTAEFAHAPSALELAAALHPSPAVAGSPTEAALAYLRDHEGLVRGRYAGPLGYLDGSGDGRFYLGIRSAVVAGPTARLIAGAGIVEGSRPEDELTETVAKFEALLPAFTAS